MPFNIIATPDPTGTIILDPNLSDIHLNAPGNYRVRYDVQIDFTPQGLSLPQNVIFEILITPATSDVGGRFSTILQNQSIISPTSSSYGNVSGESFVTAVGPLTTIRIGLVGLGGPGIILGPNFSSSQFNVASVIIQKVN